MDGEGEYIWPDGSHFKGMFKDDKKDGEGALFWPDGSHYKGMWR